MHRECFSNNDAIFSLSSATSGGTIGMLPNLDFSTGTVNVHSGEQFRALSNLRAARSHPDEVDIHPCQHGPTAPGADRARKLGTAQHYYSSGANVAFNQALSATAWPWQPNQTDYLRIVNHAPTAATVALTMNGKNALTEDEDNDRLPDAWELQYFPSIYYYDGNSDPDTDGANNLSEWAFNLNPTRPDIAALTPGTGTAGLPSIRLTGTGSAQHLTVEFVRRKNAGLTYTVQFANSPAGAGFLSAVNAPTVTPIDANWERMIVEDSVTTGDQAIRFGRVRVTAP